METGLRKNLKRTSLLNDLYTVVLTTKYHLPTLDNLFLCTDTKDLKDT